MRPLIAVFFAVVLSATQAWSLPDQGELEFQVVPWNETTQMGSRVAIFITGTDGPNGPVLPPDPGDEPIGSTLFRGSVDATRSSADWTLTQVDVTADDMTITVDLGFPIGEVQVELSDITLTMPFENVPDASGDPTTILKIDGVDDGSDVFFTDAECTECDDFGGKFTYSVDGDPIEEVALVGPLVLEMGSVSTPAAASVSALAGASEGSAITLEGTLSTGFAVDLGLAVFPLWIQADLDLLQVPEPGLGLLQTGALLPLVILARRRRRSGHGSVC
ncbi:MAG: hypothetical protein JRG96_21015 [Deltaproteobacteria bacterium]|nr:hypothetical protein [Deltaproteobacteria bacterium]MBW2421557.1 hypothetical protein [Deltaproteobacteria bacterium]